MYESKAVTTKISATSRSAIKIKDNYYTVELTEERSLPEDVEYNLEEEKRLLWDSVNSSVDEQIASIIETFK